MILPKSLINSYGCMRSSLVHMHQSPNDSKAIWWNITFDNLNLICYKNNQAVQTRVQDPVLQFNLNISWYFIEAALGASMGSVLVHARSLTEGLDTSNFASRLRTTYVFFNSHTVPQFHTTQVIMTATMCKYYHVVRPPPLYSICRFPWAYYMSKTRR
jgi:hypothetical protein